MAHKDNKHQQGPSARSQRSAKVEVILLPKTTGAPKREGKSPADKIAAMEYLTPRDVAELLQISTRSAQRLMAEGAIESFRVGSKLWRTSGKALEDYIARQRPPAETSSAA